MTKYAMYSQMAREKYGYNVWRDEDGEDVVCTAVVQDPDTYDWPDAENRGAVVKHIRRVPKSGTFSLEGPGALENW